MRLNTLGGAVLEGSGFRRPKALLLLAYLAVEGPRERRHLRALFWPEAADPALSLRALLFELRTVSPDLVKIAGSSLQLGIPADVTELLAAFSDAPESVPARYTGAFLDGLSGAELGAELEEWVFVIREFLAQQVRSNLLLQADHSSAAGDTRAAVALVQQAWRLPGASPVEVHELQQMYGLCAAAGHSLSATLLRVARELGVDLPDPPVVAPAQAPSPPKVGRFLLGATGAFIGREAELGDLQALLADPEIRLLTLLGPGGIGKTRLALEVVRTHKASNVAYVPLDAVLHAQEVPSLIANALGVDLSGSQAPLETLVSSLGSRPLLLVLDNFEQLLPTDQTFGALLNGCSALSILVTSREPLELDWESVYPLSGLDLAESEKGEAVRLFVQRARKADGRFRLTPDVWPDVVEICRQVDGSPLGIELAAAWVRTLSVGQISAELRCDVQLLERQADELTDRHRNLRLIFESTWSRLPADQQQLLSGLAVFQGGFTREAATAILDATLPQLLGLLGASLLKMTAGSRFELHPLLFSYIRRKLLEDTARRTRLCGLHARYFAAEADKAWRAFDQEVNQSHWAAWGSAEYSNLQTALEWAAEHGQLALALELCRDQMAEWINHGQVQDGINRLNLLLTAADDLTETSAYRWALLTVCYLRHCLDEVVWSEADEQRLETTVKLMRQATDAVGIFRALNLQAIIVAVNRGLDLSAGYFQAALTVAERGDFPSGQASALSNLANLALGRLDLPAARAYLTRAISIAPNNGLESNQAIPLALLGNIELHAGAYDQARACFSRMITLCTPLERTYELGIAAQGQGEAIFFRSTLTQTKGNGDLNTARALMEEGRRLSGVGGALRQRAGASTLGVADVLLMLGDLDGAKTHFEHDLMVAEQRGQRSDAKGCLIGLGQVAYELGHAERAWTHFRRALAEQVNLYGSICAIEGLAATTGRLGDGLGAVLLWSAAAHVRQSMGLPLHPIYREQHEARLEETRSTMNEVDFEMAWKAGSQHSLIAAIDLALSHDLPHKHIQRIHHRPAS